MMHKKGKILVLYILLIVLIVLFSACMSNNNTQVKKSDIQKKDTVIYLTRHGETLLNVLSRFQGWSDSPLTEEGEKLAGELGNGLKNKGIFFDRVYSSDSGRSIKTAEIILNNNKANLNIHTLKELREWYFGSFEGGGSEIIGVINQATGLSGREILTKTTWQEYANAIAKGDPKGLAENWDTVSARVMNGLDILVKETEALGGGNVLVVSHGNTISTIIENITPELLPTGNKNVIKSCSITKIIYKDGIYTVDAFNDLSYINK